MHRQADYRIADTINTGTLLPCGVPESLQTKKTTETGGLQHEFRRILKSDG